MLPYYVDRYNGFKQAIQSVMPTLEFVLKNNNQNAGLELEMRLGKFDGYHFEAGVSKEFMQSVIRMFQQFEHWHGETKWIETTDIFYAMPPTGEEVRTSRTIGEHQDWQISHIQKKKLATSDFSVSLDENKSLPYDIRFRACLEEPVIMAKLPQTVKPTNYRIKQRKRFTYGRDPNKPPVWAYDLTCSWAGKTLEEAEKKKIAENTTYEIELECLRPELYMRTAGQDEAYLATSMLLKCAQLFDVNDISQVTLEPLIDNFD